MKNIIYNEDKSKQFQIVKLIILHINGSISNKEEQILKSWINESDANKKLYKKLISSEGLNKYRNDAVNFDIQTAWNELNLKKKSELTPKLVHRILAYVALAILLVSISFFIDYNRKDINKELISEIIAPGSSRAVLKLSNGQKILLDTFSGVSITGIKDVKMANNKKLLSYNISIENINNTEISMKYANSSKTKYNEISIPKMGEYSLILSDGTKVYLNSMSKLKYPIVFDNDKRIVELEGEAFFEVTKDKSKPFIVRTSKCDITVLGTKFNVNSYKDDEELLVTLASGKVKVNVKNSKPVFLLPGEQLRENNGVMEKKKVNTRIYTSWKDGKYLFSNTRLEDIIKQVHRWYDVEVFYSSDKLKEYHFSGAVVKNQTLNQFLKKLSKSGDIEFIIKGRCVTVYSKK